MSGKIDKMIYDAIENYKRRTISAGVLIGIARDLGFMITFHPDGGVLAERFEEEDD